MSNKNLYKKLLASLAFAIAGFSTASAAPLFIGYYPDWGKWHKPAYTVDKVPYEKLTHVLWSFITPDTDGSLRGDAAEDPSALDEMVSLAHAAGTKVIVSLGGGGQSENFVPVASDDALRGKFVAKKSSLHQQVISFSFFISYFIKNNFLLLHFIKLKLKCK